MGGNLYYISRDSICPRLLYNIFIYNINLYDYTHACSCTYNPIWIYIYISIDTVYSYIQYIDIVYICIHTKPHYSVGIPTPT